MSDTVNHVSYEYVPTTNGDYSLQRVVVSAEDHKTPVKNCPACKKPAREKGE